MKNLVDTEAVSIKILFWKYFRNFSEAICYGMQSVTDGFLWIYHKFSEHFCPATFAYEKKMFYILVWSYL